MHCGKVCRSYVLICTGSVIVNTISHLFYCMQVRLIAMNELWSGRLRGVQGADLLCQVRHIHFLFPFQVLMCLLLFNTFFWVSCTGAQLLLPNLFLPRLRCG